MAQKNLEKAFDDEIQHESQFSKAPCLQPEFAQRFVTYLKEHANKRCIVITARVHPGEP